MISSSVVVLSETPRMASFGRTVEIRVVLPSIGMMVMGL